MSQDRIELLNPATMTILGDLKAFHRAHIEPLLGKPLGCLEQDILRLEQDLGHSIPDAYREFLLWMGRDYDGAFVGTDIFVDSVLDNNRYLPELLSENGVEFDLPNHYTTFYMHQGYDAAWFDLPASSSDPICWMFCEGETISPQMAGPFSSFLLSELKERLPAIKAVHGD